MFYLFNTCNSFIMYFLIFICMVYVFLFFKLVFIKEWNEKNRDLLYLMLPAL